MNTSVRLVPFSHPGNHKGPGGRQNLVPRTSPLIRLDLVDTTNNVANQVRRIDELLHPQIGGVLEMVIDLQKAVVNL